ncbi:osmoprotectant transport system permease protein [Paenibacillus shirakamiensis]|uniref:Osmoprotectant transport system permease protein n=1 Tax=Paenibacillus shirakamiensis TaxID=1265935 RepID=A0ABS4JGF0_9BACL|nr:ABC transporter permease/substrate-binding protein [Paenibacillus shirakamiensis]MBP2000125.1 osmoprotectant transport system permease protein [Paenibacillus shirakamiensis]
MNNVMNTFVERKGQLFTALLQHIQLSLVALFFALLIAIPLGIYLTRKRKVAEFIIGITAVLQTIPSLALLGLLIPLFGIGIVPAMIALIVYALLPILRNTYTGIKEVSPLLIEAASAMGMNSRKRLIKVELPLAMPVIMAGVRTAAILIIGTATMAALIGAGGLGDLILLGIDRNDSSLIILGAVPAALLAILFDISLRQMEKISFKKTMITAGVFALIVVLVVTIPWMGKGSKQELVIAGKLGSEPEILINMYKLLIEQDTDLNVELKPGLGGTSLVYNALKSGSIDIYPEFSGTAIAEFLKEKPINTDSKSVYEQAQAGMAKKLNMVMLEPMQYNNTYALAVPQKLSQQYQLKKISDLVQVQNQIHAGFTREFTDRSDGYPGLKKVYNLNFPSITTMESKLRYTALNSGDINLVDAYSTDSELQQYKMTVLEDDKHFFPPYQGAPLLKQVTLDEHPELKGVLNKLGGKVTDDEMRKMNYEVAVQGKSAKQVAEEFLREAGLLNSK